MLVDVQYVRPDRKNNLPDFIYLIWKDLLTGEKYCTQVSEPNIDIYFEKPELRTFSHNKNYEKIENLDKVTCKYTQVIPTIAKEMGDNGINFLNRIYETKDFKRLNEFML